VDYEQRIAELESGHRLLKATRVRLDAIQEVLIKSLKWLAAKFADHVAGVLISLAITAVLALLGLSG
jgi:hypothetical protein